MTEPNEGNLNGSSNIMDSKTDSKMDVDSSRQPAPDRIDTISNDNNVSKVEGGKSTEQLKVSKASDPVVGNVADDFASEESMDDRDDEESLGDEEIVNARRERFAIGKGKNRFN